MLVDWFTVGAQALNFAILVWLMKRFLYKPILHAIDSREKRIAASLADAEVKKAEAEQERDGFHEKKEELEQQRAALLSKAKDEAEAERARLLEEARLAANVLSGKRREALRTAATDLDQALRRRAQEEVFAITRRTLTDLATSSLEERMAEVFTRRLQEMDAAAKARLGEALAGASAPAVVRSAFELPDAQRAAIQDALDVTFSSETSVRFECAPELISGIELATNGQKVAWSIADYLTSLEKGVAELLEDDDKAEASADPEPKAKDEPNPNPETRTKGDPAVRAKARPEPKAEEAKSERRSA